MASFINTYLKKGPVEFLRSLIIFDYLLFIIIPTKTSKQ